MHATVATCQTTALDIALGHIPVMAGHIDAQRRLCFANPPLVTTVGYPLANCWAPVSTTASLELKVVAEGVEIREQLDYLRNAGCHALQDNLFGRALPVEQLPADPFFHAALTQPE